MKKKCFATIIAMSMIVTLMPMTVLAEEPAAEVTSIENENNENVLEKQEQIVITPDPTPVTSELTTPEPEMPTVPDEITPDKPENNELNIPEADTSNGLEENAPEESAGNEIAAPETPEVIVPEASAPETQPVPKNTENSENVVTSDGPAKIYAAASDSSEITTFNQDDSITPQALQPTITVAGTSITDLDKDLDISLDGWGTGKVRYNAADKSITLDNITVNVTNNVFITSLNNLTIIIVGNNSIILNSNDEDDGFWKYAEGITGKGNLTIKGDGNLSISAGSVLEGSDLYGIDIWGSEQMNETTLLIDGPSIDIDLSKGSYSEGITNISYSDGYVGNIVINNSKVNVKATQAIYGKGDITFSGTSNVRAESVKFLSDEIAAYDGENFDDQFIEEGRPGIYADGIIKFLLAPGGKVIAVGADAPFIYEKNDGESFYFDKAPGFASVKGFEFAENNEVTNILNSKIKECYFADGTPFYIITGEDGEVVREVVVENVKVEPVIPEKKDPVETKAEVVKASTAKVVKSSVKKTSPVTGDITNVTLWLVLSIVSAMGCAVIVKKRYF